MSSTTTRSRDLSPLRGAASAGGVTRAIGAIGIAAVPLLSACGQGQSGQAELADAAQTQSHASARDALASLDPCALLEPADRSSAGLTGTGAPRSFAGARACEYTEAGVYGVTITVDAERGLAELRVPDDHSTPARIGGHAAVKVADRTKDDGTCAVLFGLGDEAKPGSVQVDVSLPDFHDTPQACERADTVAGLIEPRLP